MIAILLIGLVAWAVANALATAGPVPRAPYGARAAEASRSHDPAAVLHEIANDVTGGCSVVMAIEQAAHAHPRLLAPARTPQQNTGVDCDHSTDERLMLTALARSRTAGSAAVAVLQRAIATLRERDAFVEERRTSAAQARLSARALTALPMGFGAFVALTSGAMRRTILSPPVTVVIACGLGLNVVGWMWMRRLIGGEA